MRLCKLKPAPLSQVRFALWPVRTSDDDLIWLEFFELHTWQPLQGIYSDPMAGMKCVRRVTLAEVILWLQRKVS